MDPDWAHAGHDRRQAVLRFERRLAHPPEKVFRAISDPAELRHWFPAARRDRAAGGRADPLHASRSRTSTRRGGEVLEVDPPKLFVYTWGDDVLRWEIVPDGAGCAAVLLADARRRRACPAGSPGSARNAAGLGRRASAALAARLDGEPRGGSRLVPAVRGATASGSGSARATSAEADDGVVLRFERDVVHAGAGLGVPLRGRRARGGRATRRAGSAPRRPAR